MSLIVEDGTGVSGANSYVTAADAIAYATGRGIPFPTDDTTVETLLINAMDYLETYRDRFTGKPVSSTQSLQYPRECSTVDGVAFPDNAIPNNLKLAECQLATDCYTTGDLMPSTDGYAVSSEKVDVLQITYAAQGRTGPIDVAAPTFPKAQAFLAPLLKTQFSLQTLRV